MSKSTNDQPLIQNGPNYSPSNLGTVDEDRVSPLSGTATPPQPSPLQERFVFDSLWQYYLKRHRLASRPVRQFDMQSLHQRERFEVAIYNGTRSLEDGPLDQKLADEIVKQQWIELGIWSREWDDQLPYSEEYMAFWLHEVPDRLAKPHQLQLDISDKAGIAPTSRDYRFFRNWKVDEEIKASRNASRPIYQFLYQVRKELEWYEEVSQVRDGLPTRKSELAAKACDAVRSRWKKWHIWNSRWGNLPGTTWRHEMTAEELQRQKMEDHNVQDVDAASIASDSTFQSEGLLIAFEAEFALEDDQFPYKSSIFPQAIDRKDGDEDHEDSVAGWKAKQIPVKSTAWHKRLSSIVSSPKDRRETRPGQFSKVFRLRYSPADRQLLSIGLWKYEVSFSRHQMH